MTKAKPLKIAQALPRRPFYLVRHGESFANRFEYPSGRMDTRLTRAGWQQARQAALTVAALGERPDIMVASALVRARDTARLIHQAGHDCRLVIDRHLGEQYYGAYQGISKHRIAASHGHEIWWQNPQDGESLEAFSHRILMTLGRWLGRYERPMFVGHGGLFTAIGHAYGRNLRGIPNAGIFHFVPAGAGWRLYRIENVNGSNKSALYCQL
ncbi:MAG: histidine phosphatase family protein [Micavibrio aeruginosavorus]|uniref:Histidine phosphatase family protein n=1 Tax=Micavibrio aeruginosavorus TaxID=349221 RepID=A0A7T5R2B4_9BACT|nr:MAG: histidine phosphatase family protein [Micavibrio aeruginosavorus]